MTAARNYAHRRGYWEAQKVQLRIISALMVREAMSRFGHENLGFFWVMGEPLLLTIGVMVVWSLMGVGHGHNVGVIPFALTGYTMITLWRHIVFRSVHAMRSNVGMLFHRNVRFLDILVARAILETLGGLAALFIAYVPLNLLGYVDDIDDPLILIGAWFLMAWWSTSFGLILAGLSEFSEAVEKIIGPVMYFSLPVTGSFFMISWLPSSVRSLAEYFPLITIFEMFRAGLLGPKIETHWNASYIATCCLVLTALGLPIIKKAQQHVRLE